MKTLFKVFFILIPFVTNAQNWEIFNSFDHYNFRQSSAPLVNSVCFADSFKVLNGDTIYFVNRIVERNNLNNYFPSDTAQLNRWQFLQKEIRRRSDGWYVLFNPGSLLINAHAGSGDSWLYDTARNIIATVVSIDTMTVFGLLDSVKVIALGNSSDSILLSRSNGILSFPSDTSDHLQAFKDPFTLQGVQTRGIGEKVIGFNDIYNFSTGDVFVYTLTFYGGYNINTTWKYRILSKQTFEDSARYQISEILWSQTQAPCCDRPVISEDTSFLVFSGFDLVASNSYPGQLMNLIYTFNGPGAYTVGPSYTFSTYSYDNNYGVRCKNFGVNHYLSPDTTQGNQLVSNANYFSGSYCVICEGLGHVHYSGGGFEYFYGLVELTGYIKNGVTYGTVPTDGDLTGISQVSAQKPLFSIFPAVVIDKLFIRMNSVPENTVYNFTLFDLTGRKILAAPLNQSNSLINCGYLSTAVYLWRISDERGNVIDAGKIIKQ